MVDTTVQSRNRELLEIPSFAARVIVGPGKGASAVSIDGRLTIGTDEDATLRLEDPTVSRFHLEIVATQLGLVVRDLGSKNGSLLHGVDIREVILRDSADIDIGRTRVRIVYEGERSRLGGTEETSFGDLLGASAPMRAVFARLRKAAPTSASVLITGESGTGKELAASAVHRASARADGPFEIVDCGGLPPTLVESELFGHERGAFTGAHHPRVGAFERAHGGTLFLDEIGELPLDLQPKLLRVLGEGQIRRVGGQGTIRVDVRVVAATHRDLRRAVNTGAFRSDLYHRLAVLEVRMPALRERFDDLPLVGGTLLARIQKQRGVESKSMPEAFWKSLERHDWPGNVRELRNYLEQCVIFEDAQPLAGETAAGADEPEPAEVRAWLASLASLPMQDAKSTLIDRFERDYLARVLEMTDGNVAEAARRSGVDRRTLFRLLRRIGRGE